MVKFYLRELVIWQPLAFYAEQPASKVIPCFHILIADLISSHSNWNQWVWWITIQFPYFCTWTVASSHKSLKILSLSWTLCHSCEACPYESREQESKSVSFRAQTRNPGIRKQPWIPDQVRDDKNTYDSWVSTFFLNIFLYYVLYLICQYITTTNKQSHSGRRKFTTNFSWHAFRVMSSSAEEFKSGLSIHVFAGSARTIQSSILRNGEKGTRCKCIKTTRISIQSFQLWSWWCSPSESVRQWPTPTWWKIHPPGRW